MRANSTRLSNDVPAIHVSDDLDNQQHTGVIVEPLAGEWAVGFTETEPPADAHDDAVGLSTISVNNIADTDQSNQTMSAARSAANKISQAIPHPAAPANDRAFKLSCGLALMTGSIGGSLVIAASVMAKAGIGSETTKTSILVCGLALSATGLMSACSTNRVSAEIEHLLHKLGY